MEGMPWRTQPSTAWLTLQLAIVIWLSDRRAFFAMLFTTLAMTFDCGWGYVLGIYFNPSPNGDPKACRGSRRGRRPALYDQKSETRSRRFPRSYSGVSL